MNFDASALLGLGYACFIIAFVLYVYCLLNEDFFCGQLATVIQVGGLLLWSSGAAWHILENKIQLGAGFDDLLLIFPIACVAVSLIEEQIWGSKLLSPVVLLIVLLLGGCVVFDLAPDITARDLYPASFNNVWFIAYYLFALLGYGILLMSAVWGIVELLRPLLQNRMTGYVSLPATAVEDFSRQSILWALVVLTATLSLGAWWAWLASGRYWHWNLAEAWMLATWAIYGAYVHLKRLRRWAIITALGLLLVAFSIGTLAA